MAELQISGLTRAELATYVRAQIQALVPLPRPEPELGLIEVHLDEALARLAHCIAAVRTWPAGHFDVLHSSQYCTFLYYLANTIWRHERAQAVCTRLFLLNKALNAIDCFYEIELPEVFFIGHSIGIVLAKASYGNHLVLYQNVTVGKNHGVAPVLEDGVILYPHAAVIGACTIRRGSIIAQGTRVLGRDTEAGRIAFNSGTAGKLAFRAPGHPILADFFRDV